MAILEPAPEDEPGVNSCFTAGALALSRGTRFAIDGRPATAAGEHRAIVEATSTRDPDAVETAARAHIAAAQRARLRLILEDENS